MKIGFIGLGIMGRPIMKNLLKAGYRLVINDFNRDTVADAVSCGAVAASSGAGAASQCEVIVTMVPNSLRVRTAALGEGSIAEGARPGAVLISMSSIDPIENKAIDTKLAERSIEVIDCLVPGGEPKAINGTLSVMCGDKKELFDKYYGMLIVMADSVVYVGELGSDNVAKPANQIVVAANIAAVSEVLTFAKKAGTGPELVYQATRGGLAGSTVMDAKAPMMFTRNFKPGSCTELHIKDLSNVLNAARATSFPVPLAGQLMEIMQGLKTDGFEKEGHSNIVKYHREIANTTVKS